MEIQRKEIEGFISQCLLLEDYLKNCLITEERDFVENTLMRIPAEVNLPDDIDGEPLVDEDGNIIKAGAMFLLDNFDPVGDSENLSFDIGLYKGFESAIFLTCHFLGINQELVKEIVEK